MNTQEKIIEDIKTAMRARDEFTTTTLRTILATIKNTEIAKLKRDVGLEEEEIVEVLSREVKQRHDAILDFTRGNRPDLATKNQREIDLIKRYMPEAFSETKIMDIIRETLNKTGATAMSQFGMVMKEIMPKIKGRADSAIVAQIIKEKLK